MIFYQVFDSTSCFPLPVTIGGTFTSEGAFIVTNIVSDLKVGDYLYSTTNNELKLVASIQTPTRYTLESSFTVNVVNEEIKIADKTIVYTKASLFNFEKVDGLFNGNTFPKRSTINVDEGIINFTLDGTGTKISIIAV